MAKIETFFAATDPSPKRVLVSGHVFIPRAVVPVIPITFEVDSGCPFTVLVDNDFLAALAAIDVFFKGEYSDWIKKNPHWICPIGTRRTLGGTTEPIYQIVDSQVFLCNKGADFPDNCQPLGPVHGMFSRSFEQAGKPHNSLLGRETLQNVETLRWKAKQCRVWLSVP